MSKRAEWWFSLLLRTVLHKNFKFSVFTVLHNRFKVRNLV